MTSYKISADNTSPQEWEKVCFATIEIINNTRGGVEGKIGERVVCRGIYFKRVDLAGRGIILNCLK